MLRPSKPRLLRCQVPREPDVEEMIENVKAIKAAPAVPPSAA